MTIDDVRAALYVAARLRFPRLREFDSTTGKVEALEDYLAETAIHRGVLEEARLHMTDALRELLEQWDDIEGWEMMVPSTRRTQDDIRRAKKKCRPDLHGSIGSAKHLVARLSDQIRRLERDDDAASREYTIVTGG